MLQGDKLHWTVRSALHDRTMEAMVQPLAGALARLKAKGEISCHLDADDVTLARILIKGSEAVVHGEGSGSTEWFRSEMLRKRLAAFWACIIEFE